MGALLACALTVNAQTLAERLGYKATDRLLIINADDAGMNHGANAAIINVLENGIATSSTIMAPCPWFKEFAEYARYFKNPAKSLGVHLTFNSEWENYRFGPISRETETDGLVDPEGYLWSSAKATFAHASPMAILIEGRAQIERCLKAGIDISHLDSHIGTIYDPRYVEIYLQLAKEYNLPVRLPSQEMMARNNASDIRKKFTEAGILMCDHIVHHTQESFIDPDHNVKKKWMETIKHLRPGVNDLFIHPNLLTDEAKAIMDRPTTAEVWGSKGRAIEAELFLNDPDLIKLIKEEGIILISYRQLRDVQRAKE